MSIYKKLSFNFLKVSNQKNLSSVKKISFFNKKVDKEDDVEIEEVVEEEKSMWSDLSDEEITKIQNRSSLTVKERDLLFGNLTEKIQLTELYQYKTPYVRNLYAKFGKESGLKPGVCWPRKEELAFKKQFEKEFYPSLESLINESNLIKEKEQKEIESREKEIRKGLKNLEKYKKEFFKKYDEVQSEAKDKIDKELKRIEEIRDFLGYDMNPSDPRFEAAAEKKAELERKQMIKRGLAKKSKQEKLLEELKQLIESSQKKEENNTEESEIKTKEINVKNENKPVNEN